MSPTSLEERLQKLKSLQKKKTEGLKQNRDELFKEHRKNAVGDGKLRSLEQKQSKAQEELDKLEVKERGENWERKKGWDYSIEDHERWDKKQAEKQMNVVNAGFTNYSQLAEQSYKKEISQLSIDKESYQRAKEAKKNEASEGISEEIVDFSNKPSKQAIDNLVGTLKSSDSRKLKRRKKNEETENYINDKNKDFNEKLNRHYDKYIK